MIISSVQNLLLKNVLKLREKKFRDQSGLFIVEGQKQIKEITEKWNIKQVFISEKCKNAVINFKNPIIVSERLFNKISMTQSPQGIIAIVEKKQYDIEKLLKYSGFFIILEDIQDPGNLGTIIRSADAFNAKAIFVSKGSADVYSDKTIRATMGAIFHLPVIDNVNIGNILALLKREKFTIFAASLKGKKYLNNTKIPNKSVFLIGNEGTGLKNETEKLADELIKIYMHGNSQSLNVAIATSIIMYEMTRNNKIFS
jgi:TrmH family RNA methyltransferase